jgi:hypothetical protein
MKRQVNEIIKQILDLEIENAYIKYYKAFDKMTNRTLLRSKLEEMTTPKLVALARYISEVSAYPEVYVDEIIQIADVINSRYPVGSSDIAYYSIEQVKFYARNYHPYGLGFDERIDRVVGL